MSRKSATERNPARFVGPKPRTGSTAESNLSFVARGCRFDRKSLRVAITRKRRSCGSRSVLRRLAALISAAPVIAQTSLTRPAPPTRAPGSQRPDAAAPAGCGAAAASRPLIRRNESSRRNGRAPFRSCRAIRTTAAPCSGADPVGPGQQRSIGDLERAVRHALQWICGAALLPQSDAKRLLRYAVRVAGAAAAESRGRMVLTSQIRAGASRPSWPPLSSARARWQAGGAPKHLAPIPAPTVALMAARDTTASAPIPCGPTRRRRARGLEEGPNGAAWKPSICRWSGQLGPKRTIGDRQTPEGFYSVGPRQMNPNSSLPPPSTSVPERLRPRAWRHRRLSHGARELLVGGCFAMTDKAVEETALARRPLRAGSRPSSSSPIRSA